MTNKRLLEILKLIGNVRSSSWKDVRKIVDIMSTVEVISQEWHEFTKQDGRYWRLLDLSNIKTWSTYDRKCIDLIFSNKEDKLYCNAKIYDGDVVDGFPTNIRFTATLILPDNFTQEIKDLIRQGVDSYAVRCYDEMLEKERHSWISKLVQKILT